MPARVLLTKIGLDGHDRGVRMIAFELRNRGAEVIQLGIVTTPEDIVQAALQEDVDVLGVSVLSGAHMVLVPKLTRLLTHEGLGDLPVVCGGTIPGDDIGQLVAAGVARVCPTGTSVTEAADALLELASTHPKTKGAER